MLRTTVRRGCPTSPRATCSRCAPSGGASEATPGSYYGWHLLAGDRTVALATTGFDFEQSSLRLDAKGGGRTPFRIGTCDDAVTAGPRAVTAGAARCHRRGRAVNAWGREQSRSGSAQSELCSGAPLPPEGPIAPRHAVAGKRRTTCRNHVSFFCSSETRETQRTVGPTGRTSGLGRDSTSTLLDRRPELVVTRRCPRTAGVPLGLGDDCDLVAERLDVIDQMQQGPTAVAFLSRSGRC